ncbi:MAG: SprT family zinc-dependent metalloprotease [Aestuariivirga sp.]
MRRATPPAPEPQIIEIDGRAVALRFRRNAAAKRMVLRLDGKSGGLVMTLPKRSSLIEALRFVEQSRDWISRTLAKQPEPAKFVDGSSILYRGQLHVLHISGGPRGIVQVSQGGLHVPGKPEHAPRRLKDFLAAEAKRELVSASRRYADAMATKFARVSIRDQKSRWGSCSAGGVLSYSWRLILAPDYVLDYVAAHEVAHLREMNHGPRFWRLVLTHCPHARTAKQWLKTNGSKVHHYL